MNSSDKHNYLFCKPLFIHSKNFFINTFYGLIDDEDSSTLCEDIPSYYRIIKQLGIHDTYFVNETDLSFDNEFNEIYKTDNKDKKANKILEKVLSEIDNTEYKEQTIIIRPTVFNDVNNKSYHLVFKIPIQKNNHKVKSIIIKTKPITVLDYVSVNMIDSQNIAIDGTCTKNYSNINYYIKQSNLTIKDIMYYTNRLKQHPCFLIIYHYQYEKGKINFIPKKQTSGKKLTLYV